MIHLPKSLLRDDGTWRHPGGSKSAATTKVQQRRALIEAALRPYVDPIPIREGGRLFRRLVDDLTREHPAVCDGLTEAMVGNVARELGLWPWTPGEIDRGVNPAPGRKLPPDTDETAVREADRREALAMLRTGTPLEEVGLWLGYSVAEVRRWRDDEGRKR